MITYSNLQQSAASYLLAHHGQRLTLTRHQLKQAGFEEFHALEAWMERHGLQCQTVGTDFTFWHGELPPPDPSIPPQGTPIDQLHPGNRFRVMFGQSLLPQSPSDGNILRGGNAQKNY